MQIQIYVKDVELTDDVKSYAEEKIGGVEKVLNNIVNLEIDLSKTTNHHQQGDIYKASANVNIPGETIHGEFEAESLFAAIDGLDEELTREARKMKGKREAKQMKGLRKIKDVMTSFLTRKNDQVENEDMMEE